MPSYNNNVPLTSNKINSTTQTIHDNFAIIDSPTQGFPVNHVEFNGTLPGYHTRVDFDSNHVPTVAPVDPSSVIYTQNDSNGHPVPVFGNSQCAVVAGLLVGFPLLFQPTLVTSGTNFGFRLGSLIINYGTVAAVNTSGTTVTFAIAFTTASSYAINATPNAALNLQEGQWTVTTTASSSAVIRRGTTAGGLPGGTLPATYIAIGT